MYQVKGDKITFGMYLPTLFCVPCACCCLLYKSARGLRVRARAAGGSSQRPGVLLNSSGHDGQPRLRRPGKIPTPYVDVDYFVTQQRAHLGVAGGGAQIDRTIFCVHRLFARRCPPAVWLGTRAAFDVLSCPPFRLLPIFPSNQIAEKFPDKAAKLVIGCQMGSRSAQVCLGHDLICVCLAAAPNAPPLPLGRLWCGARRGDGDGGFNSTGWRLNAYNSSSVLGGETELLI